MSMQAHARSAGRSTRGSRRARAEAEFAKLPGKKKGKVKGKDPSETYAKGERRPAAGTKPSTAEIERRAAEEGGKGPWSKAYSEGWGSLTHVEKTKLVMQGGGAVAGYKILTD